MFGDRGDSGDPRFELLKLRLELREPKRQLFALASLGKGSAEAFALWKMIALHELCASSGSASGGRSARARPRG